MKNNYSLFLSKEFNKQIDAISKEDGYQYEVLVSSGNASFYKCPKEDVINNHIKHIVSDYEDEGYEVVASHGYIKGAGVYAELYMRKVVEEKGGK